MFKDRLAFFDEPVDSTISVSDTEEVGSPFSAEDAVRGAAAAGCDGVVETVDDEAFADGELARNMVRDWF